MLVIVRQVGELIRISDDIIISVSSVKGQIVKFGITAPKDVSVHKEEIYQKLAMHFEDSSTNA